MANISGQFGKSVAGLTLEKLVKEHNISRRKKATIGKTIEDLNKGMSFIKHGEDTRLYERFWQLWVKDVENRAKALQLPQDLETHLLATINGLGKQHRRLFNIVHNRKRLGKKRVERLRGVLRKYNKKFGIALEKMNGK